MHDADRLPHQSGVARWADLVAALGLSAVRWRLGRGEWQRPARGVVVLHNGPLTPEQHLLVDVLLCGRGAVLAGITAAERAGLTGWSDPFGRRFVLVPHPRKVAHDRSGLVVKSSTTLDDRAVLGALTPPRTRIQRSLVDAAVWAGSDRAAHGVLLAGVQQRLVLPGMLAAEVARRRANERRRRVLERAVADAAGGSHTLTEADFSALCRRHGLPWPDRQAARRDARGKNRWLDVEWYEYGLVVEIDGAGHMELRQWCDDSLRDAAWVATGARVMRLPSIVVRDEPELVATLVREALRGGGWVPAAA